MRSLDIVTSNSPSSSEFRPLKTGEFCRLPQEIIGQIFEHIEKKDYPNLKSICRLFQITIEYYQKEIALRSINSTLPQRYPNLEKIYIRDFRKIFNDWENHQLTSLQKLTSLHMQNPLRVSSLCGDLSDKVVELKYDRKNQIWNSPDEITRCKNLQTLTIRHCRIKSMSINCMHLKSIELRNVRGFCDQMMADIEKLPHLETLVLSKRYRGALSEFCQASLKRIHKMEKLKILCLNNMKISCDFVGSLRDLKELRILSMTNCNTIFFSVIGLLFFQKIQLLDLSNSILGYQREFVYPANFDMRDYEYNCSNINECGYYENSRVDIFKKIDLSLSDELINKAMKHMQFKAPLIIAKKGEDIKPTSDWSAKLIQNAPFLSVHQDPSILKIKKNAMALLTTPLPIITGKGQRNYGVGVGAFLKQMDFDLRDDLKLVCAAIDDGTPHSLQNLIFASPRIRLDFESMLTLCKIKINALRYAHPQIHKQLYLKLVTSSGRSLGRELGKAEDTGRHPPLTDELACAIVEFNGLDLQYLLPVQRAQAKFAVLAIKNNLSAFDFVSDRMYEFSFMKSILKNCGQILSSLPDILQRLYLHMFCNMSNLISYADISIQSDREFCLCLVRKNCAMFEYLTPQLRDDGEIAHLAISQYPQMSRFISRRLRKSMHFASRAILEV